MRAHVAGAASEAFADLVDCAYQAAIDGNAWPAFLTRFADALHGHNTALLVNELASRHNQAIACVRTDPEQLRVYNEYYYRLNPWIAKGSSDLALGRVAVGVGEMYFPGDDLLRTEFYSDWLRPQKLKHSIAALIMQSKDRIVLCSSLRTASQGPFTAKDIALYESLLPHLRRAVLTRERASGVLDAGRQALDLLENSPDPCILFDQTLKPVCLNRAARDLLTANCGVSLKNGILAGSRTEDTGRLQKLIARAAAARPSGGEMAIFRERGQPLLILVSPIPPHCEWPLGSRATVAVWISDPNRKAVSRVKRIQNLFGLTPAEAVVATELAQGLSLHEIADVLEISRHTVRNHLKHILEKTGARRQTDVVRLVLSCPDPFES